MNQKQAAAVLRKLAADLDCVMSFFTDGDGVNSPDYETIEAALCCVAYYRRPHTRHWQAVIFDDHQAIKMALEKYTRCVQTHISLINICYWSNYEKGHRWVISFIKQCISLLAYNRLHR